MKLNNALLILIFIGTIAISYYIIQLGQEAFLEDFATWNSGGLYCVIPVDWKYQLLMLGVMEKK